MWSPVQLALVREAGIAGNSLSAGLTALRKANYAAPGIYSHAFFNFSIGLKRTLKLIYILDYLLEHNKYPEDSDLKRLGHDIAKLFNHAIQIKDMRGLTTGGNRITAQCIEMAIVEFMGRFARSSRYYNLNYITGSYSSGDQMDPLTDWFENVGVPVLTKHFTKRQETRVRRNAELIEQHAGMFMTVQFTAEDGTSLHDTFSAFYHTGKTEILRKYGTLYAARLCRHIYYILWDLTRKCQGQNIPIPYLDELFFPFMNDDRYFLSIKTFPPRGQ